jgi:hypothetical protein
VEAVSTMTADIRKSLLDLIELRTIPVKEGSPPVNHRIHKTHKLQSPIT